MSKDSDHVSREDLAYQLVKERLAQQIESVKNLDIKASITLAIIGVIFSGYLQSVVKHVDSKGLKVVTFVILMLAGIFAVATFVQIKHDWRNDPDPQQLLNIVTSQDFKDYKDEEITRYILVSMANSYKQNKSLYGKRYWFLYVALLLVLLAVIMIVVQVIFEV